MDISKECAEDKKGVVWPFVLMVGCLCAPLVLLLLLALYLNFAGAGQQSVNLGMSMDEVVEQFGSPDAVFRFPEGLVLCYPYDYSAQTTHGGGTLSEPAQVGSPRDVPWAYNNYKLVFGPKGHLVAWTRDGEMGAVMSNRGNMPESLDSIPEEVWRDILGD
jgi:hypothetical protein